LSSPRIYDVAVIGAGPGGYVAGIAAARRGLAACVIEKDVPGGVCLNWGCIPSKSLIHEATRYAALAGAEELGIRVDRREFSYARVQAKSRQAAATLANGVRGLLRRNDVELLQATARIAEPGTVLLSGGVHDGVTITARNLIVATGSRPMSVRGFEIDERDVLSSNGILAMTELPESLVILGAGAIGCEFAYVMNAFGVAVTLVEMASQILPAEDAEVAAVVAAAFRSRGIDVRAGCRAGSLRRTVRGVEVELLEKGTNTTVCASRVLAAFGRVPNTQSIGLETVGVRCDERGRIVTGAFGETSVPGIYAIGDVTCSPALAHVASKEAEIAVARIALGDAASLRGIDPSLVPSAVYCEPQVAGFGLREEQAKAEGVKYCKSVFPYRGIGKSIAVERAEGMVKILADPDTGEILGAHIVGAEATELIHELLLARHAELLAEDVASMIHAHPTLAEGVMEAARGVRGRAIHV
jgi:dihydrolipoamide dehydrogenase